MRKLAALVLGVIPLSVAAAPVPKAPPAPSIEGKYTVLAQGRSGFGKAARPGAFAGPADPEERGFTSSLRRGTTITKDTISIESRTAVAPTIWEYRLDPSTKPMSIDIMIVPVLGKKTRVHGIVEQTDDRLKIAYTPEGSERPKDFDDTETATVYVFQKTPPPPRFEYKIVALKVGSEADAEKRLNELAKQGYDLSHSTSPAGQEPVIHLILKRTVR